MMMVVVMMMMMVMMFVALMTPPVIAAMMVHGCSLGSRFVLRHGLRGTRQRAQEQGAAQDGAGQKCFQHIAFLSGGLSRRAFGAFGFRQCGAPWDSTSQSC
jgi:hypothetical protein